MIFKFIKIIDSIEEHVDFQFVLADFALAIAVLDSMERNPIENLGFSPQFYTTVDPRDTPDKPGQNNMFIYSNLSKIFIEDKLVERLDKRVAELSAEWWWSFIKFWLKIDEKNSLKNMSNSLR